jgi:hypothetical protein
MKSKKKLKDKKVVNYRSNFESVGPNLSGFGNLRGLKK